MGQTKVIGAGEGDDLTRSSKSGISSSFSSTLREKWKEAVFLVGVTGISMFVGFSRAISNSKKAETDAFDKIPEQSVVKVHNEATKLALRALKWGTFYAVFGTTILCFTVWKLVGVSNLQEFRTKVGKMLPRISKSADEPQGRNNFESLSDLMQYLIDEDEKSKKFKQEAEEHSKKIPHDVR